MQKNFLPLLLFYISISVYSQNSNFTILCIAAHPDDEDGATLAYYSRIKGFDAYTIFYTRGEGGQNEIGPELYDELGKIRERECYDAAEIQGSKVYFLGFLDLGYSKTAKETFKFWGGEDSVLARIVYIIRVIRPDVVITNHDTITTKPKRQHGHHQVSGITIYNAFEKAADPNYHPEQLVNGVEPWKIKKLYFRQNDTNVNDVFEIDVSQKDKSGKTIEEIYYDALAKHKTQGMDKVDRNYTGKRRYELIRSDKTYPVSRNDLFEGIAPTEKPKINVELKSYPTRYTYYKINPEDSLRILNSLKFRKGIKIGLVRTYDNSVENVLKAFQIDFDTLSDYDLNEKPLYTYSTIILDIRAYFYRPELIKNNHKILNYIADSGSVVCFYHKPSDWNGRNFAPYPIYLTNQRVTEEGALVKQQKNTLYIWSEPNIINHMDWDGWIQERNIYLPSDDTSLTSRHYSRLLSMQDENDPVPSTSLMIAGYEKGTYVYCSLALYRQLKLFHEGALKLFLNMISLSRWFRY